MRAVRAFNNLTIQPFINLPKPKSPQPVAVAVPDVSPKVPSAAAASAATQVQILTPKEHVQQTVTPAPVIGTPHYAVPVPAVTPPHAIPSITPAAAASASTHTDACRYTFGDVGDKLARLGDLPRLYPPGYQPPSLFQAMTDAGVPSSEKVSAICDDVAACAVADGLVNCTRLTKEDVAAIAMYTFDFGSSDREHNPYRLINGGLFERNALQLRNIRGLIYRLLHALRSVQPVRPQALFRGIREHVKLNDSHYHKGNKITWHTFSSTTTDMQTTQNFLTDPATGKCEGTLFIIHGTPWGYSIKPFSCFPNEEEILLEPEIDLRVTGIINAPLIVVDLEMLPDQKLLLENLIPRNVGAIVTLASPSAGAVAPAPPATAAPAPPATVQYIAKAGWESTVSGGLSFKKGDVITILDGKNHDWWMGELNGNRGWVPASYLRDSSS